MGGDVAVFVMSASNGKFIGDMTVAVAVIDLKMYQFAVFTEHQDHVLNNFIERFLKIVLVCGDVNIELMKSNDMKTVEFVTAMLSMSL